MRSNVIDRFEPFSIVRVKLELDPDAHQAPNHYTISKVFRLGRSPNPSDLWRIKDRARPCQTQSAQDGNFRNRSRRDCRQCCISTDRPCCTTNIPRRGMGRSTRHARNLDSCRNILCGNRGIDHARYSRIGVPDGRPRMGRQRITHPRDGVLADTVKFLHRPRR